MLGLVTILSALLAALPSPHVSPLPDCPVQLQRFNVTIQPQQTQTTLTFSVPNNAAVGGPLSLVCARFDNAKNPDRLVLNHQGNEMGFDIAGFHPGTRFGSLGKDANDASEILVSPAGQILVVQMNTDLDVSANRTTITGTVNVRHHPQNRVSFKEVLVDGIATSAEFDSYRNDVTAGSVRLTLDTSAKNAPLAVPTLYLACFASREFAPSSGRKSPECFP